MLAEHVHHVVGVDPDRDWITLAVLDAPTSGVIAAPIRTSTTRDGALRRSPPPAHRWPAVCLHTSHQAWASSGRRQWR